MLITYKSLDQLYIFSFTKKNETSSQRNLKSKHLIEHPLSMIDI